MGSPIGGASFNAFAGVLFTVPPGKIWKIDEVGARMQIFKGKLFAAIFSVPPDALGPRKRPYEITENMPGLIAHTLFSSGKVEEQTIPLRATLPAGNYLLLFGNRILGADADADATLPYYYPDAGTENGTFVFWNNLAPNSNSVDAWSRTNMRAVIVMKGASYSATTGLPDWQTNLLLAVLGALTVCILARYWRKF